MAWGLGIGAGVGLLKNEFVDKPQAAIQNKLQATTERYSPWTKQEGHFTMPPNGFDDALSMGTTGALVARGLKQKPNGWIPTPDYTVAGGNDDLTNAALMARNPIV
jgi:hypothetical protein